MKPYPITIHRSGAQTRNADDEWVPGPETDSFTTGYVGPASPTRLGREFTIGRQTVVIDAVAVLDKDTDITETDQLTANGVRYRVRLVFEAKSPSGQRDYIRCDLQAVR